VAPAEVDVVLAAHPDFLDVAVAGVPDEQWGEIVTAFVVPRPGSDVDIATLRSFCAARLAPHKQPRNLVVVETIPRTGTTGQVQRRLLVAAAQAAKSGSEPIGSEDG
jgi:fatty-acyl-CoA synthase